MDFFAQQAKVRRSSHTLVGLFVLAVIAIVAAVDLVCAWALGIGADPATLAGISVLVLAVIGLCSVYRIASLGGGGAAVARHDHAAGEQRRDDRGAVRCLRARVGGARQQARRGRGEEVGEGRRPGLGGVAQQAGVEGAARIAHRPTLPSVLTQPAY